MLFFRMGFSKDVHLFKVNLVSLKLYSLILSPIKIYCLILQLNCSKTNFRQKKCTEITSLTHKHLFCFTLNIYLIKQHIR